MGIRRELPLRRSEGDRSLTAVRCADENNKGYWEIKSESPEWPSETHFVVFKSDKVLRHHTSATEDSELDAGRRDFILTAVRNFEKIRD